MFAAKIKFHPFHQAERNFFSMISFAQSDYENLIAYASGVHAPNLNPALITQVDESLIDNIKECKAFYTNNRLPWALVLPDYLYNNALEQLLHTEQFTLDDKGITMSLDLRTIHFPTQTSKLQIKETSKDLRTWSIPLTYAFESTPEITNIYVTRHSQAQKPGVTLFHYSGFIDNTVVCSLSLSVAENYARIDDVATMPAHQNKGYATELIYHALQELQPYGVETCFLEASMDGWSIYKRIGFQELFQNYYYVY